MMAEIKIDNSLERNLSGSGSSGALSEGGQKVINLLIRAERSERLLKKAKCRPNEMGYTRSSGAPRMRSEKAFTIVELMVATTLFVSLMGLVTIAFARLSNASEKALQVLSLHTRADTIQRQLERDFRAMLPVAAVHLQAEEKPYTITFMRQVTDLHPSIFRNYVLKPGTNPFEQRFFSKHRMCDTVWIRYRWGEGSLDRGLSRVNELTLHRLDNNGTDWHSNTENHLYTPEYGTRPATGVQANAITPMVQRHYDFFEGKGSLNQVSADGTCIAKAGDRIAVYEEVSTAVKIGDRKNPELMVWNKQDGDYRHLYTTIETGNVKQLSDPDVADDNMPDDGQNDAYAVRNADGNSVNKDRLNIIGATDVYTDSNGEEHQLYPTQIQPLFDGVEYMQLELIGRNGEVMDGGDETDRLSDGNKSLDFSGLHPATGEGFGARPISVRVSFLLHAINNEIKDDEDFNDNGDVEELLSLAIRDKVASESLATRADEIAAFERYALSFGYSCMYFVQGIQVGQ